MPEVVKEVVRCFRDGACRFVSYPFAGKVDGSFHVASRDRGIGRHFAKVGRRVTASCGEFQKAHAK